MYGIRICSFHDADGEVTDSRGRVWRFEFSKMFGPLLVGKTGVVLKNQTMTGAFWEAFYDWYEAKYGELEWRKAEREHAADLARARGLGARGEAAGYDDQQQVAPEARAAAEASS